MKAGLTKADSSIASISLLYWHILIIGTNSHNCLNDLTKLSDLFLFIWTWGSAVAEGPRDAFYQLNFVFAA